MNTTAHLTQVGNALLGVLGSRLARGEPLDESETQLLADLRDRKHSRDEFVAYVFGIPGSWLYDLLGILTDPRADDRRKQMQRLQERRKGTTANRN